MAVALAGRVIRGLKDSQLPLIRRVRPVQNVVNALPLFLLGLVEIVLLRGLNSEQSWMLDKARSEVPAHATERAIGGSTVRQNRDPTKLLNFCQHLEWSARRRTALDALASPAQGADRRQKAIHIRRSHLGVEQGDEVDPLIPCEVV